MRNGKREKTAVSILCYLAGGALYALAITLFLEPNGLVTGGFSGLAMIGNRLFAISTGLIIFALNIPIFIIGLKRLGKGFIIRSILATAFTSAFIELFEQFLPPFHCHQILAALAGGILSGAGLALILIRGGSTGGSDIIAKLVHLKFPHIALGRAIMAFDIAVIAFNALLFRGIENALYSILMIGISAATLDYLIYGTKSGKLLLIITENGEQISKQVNLTGGRGATIVPAVGAYTGKRHAMIVSVVKPHEIGKIYDIVAAYDTNAFVTLLDAREIRGLGFRQSYE